MCDQCVLDHRAKKQHSWGGGKLHLCFVCFAVRANTNTRNSTVQYDVIVLFSSGIAPDKRFMGRSMRGGGQGKFLDPSEFREERAHCHPLSPTSLNDSLALEGSTSLEMLSCTTHTLVFPWLLIIEVF